MSETEPLVDEDEEQQVNGLGDAVRRVFGAGRRSASDPDNFTGSFRGVPAPKRGGQAWVKAEDTLGDDTHCWCGQEAGHDWPGKAERAPHPRVTVEQKEDNMAASAAETFATNDARLERRQMRKFDARVTTMVMELVNTYGVKWRMQKDGQHILLSPLNGAFEGRPHKVGAARHPEQTLDHLERWVKQAVTPALVESKAEVLAEKFNDPSKVRRARRAVRQEEAASRPEPAAVAPPEPQVDPEPPAEENEAQEPLSKAARNLAQAVELGFGEPPEVPEGMPAQPEGYTRVFTYKSMTRGWTNWWGNEDRTHFICMWGDFDTDDLQHHGAHMRKHTQPREKLQEAGRKAAATRQRNKDQRAVTEALQVLMNATGVKILDDRPDQSETVTKLDAKVAELGTDLNKMQALLDKVQRERDQAVAERDAVKAKLDLIREGLSL